MIIQDYADELLAILYANPEKIDRHLLQKYKLGDKLFSHDKAQQILFRLINTASYANKQVNDAFIEVYASRNKLSKEVTDEVKFALERVKECDSDFSYLPEKIEVYKREVKTYYFRKLLLASNEDLNSGKKQIEDIILEARQQLQDISMEDEGSTLVSTRNYTQKFLDEYQKESDDGALYYGMKPLDDSIKFIMPGELHLIAGASNEGKSIVLLNIIYNNVVYHKKNCLLDSLEMGTQQYLYRMISLHSTHPKFGYNIPHEKIKKKELDPTEEEHFFEVLQDLFENPEYGQLFFAEGASTPDELFAEAESINKFIHLDGIFIDYLSLLQGKGTSEQAMIANNFKAIKHYALTFDNNRKIPVVTVHQISEQAKAKAEETGTYDFNFLSDTSEAKKSIDAGFWILRTQAHKESREVGMGIFKVRDGAFPPNFSLFEQFEFSKVQAIDSTIE